MVISKEISMLIQTLLPRSIRALCAVVVVPLGLMMSGMFTAGAQQTTYLLDINGREVRIDGITFGGAGGSRPEAGAATLRMRAENGDSPLSQLAQTGSQPRLLLQYRDPQSNGMVHYEFDDVRFGRVRQIGRGSDAVESLD